MPTRAVRSRWGERASSRIAPARRVGELRAALNVTLSGSSAAIVVESAASAATMKKRRVPGEHSVV